MRSRNAVPWKLQVTLTLSEKEFGRNQWSGQV
jgi:hypothetical protein